jgi:hypothetical protein
MCVRKSRLGAEKPQDVCFDKAYGIARPYQGQARNATFFMTALQYVTMIWP